MKIAVIGTGQWGKNHIKTLGKMGFLGSISNFEVSADIQNLSKMYDAPLCSNQEIFDDKAIKAVVLATPTDTHYLLGQEALRSGKHLFIEKPMSYSPKECSHLENIAQEENRILMVGHILQYHPAFVWIKNFLPKQSLGQILFFYAERKNFGVIRANENVLWDLAPHDLSMMLHVLPTPTHVQCMESHIFSSQHADVADLYFKFPGSLKAHISVNRISPRKNRTVIITGEYESIIFDDTQPWEQKIYIMPTHFVFNGTRPPLLDKKEGVYVPIQPEEPLKNELNHFIECIAKGLQPITPAQEAKNISHIIEKATKDLKKNPWVPLF